MNITPSEHAALAWAVEVAEAATTIARPRAGNVPTETVLRFRIYEARRFLAREATVVVTESRRTA